MDDATVHELVQRVGARAEAQTQARLKTVPSEIAPERRPSAQAVVMIDGWLARFRGPGWGAEKTDEPRVAWHELKTGVFYRHEQASENASGRGLLAEKVIVSWQGQAVELGERLHHEAIRRGLGRAQAVEAVGDGAPWIWNLVAERWAPATQVLDFCHASEHLWELGRALHPKAETKVPPWVEEGLPRLRHGQEQKVLKEIAGLKAGRSAAGKIVRREQNYFASQAGRMAYATVAGRVGPLGAARWNRPAGKRSAATNARASFGRPEVCAISELWKKPAPTDIGINSGSSSNGGAYRMRPVTT